MLLKASSAFLLIFIWQIFSLFLPTNILPGPWPTTITLVDNITEGLVGYHLYTTLLRVSGGLVLAMAIGILIGVVMGVSRTAAKFLDMWVMIGLAIPSLCYALVCFIWFGLNEGSAILAIAITGAPSIAINIWEGVKNVDNRLVKMAEAYEASKLQILWHVLVPQIFPYIVASLRFGLGVIWKITVLIELIGRPNGVGFQLFYWYQLADMEQVLAWTMLFTLVMVAIEYLIIQRIERRLFVWRQEVKI